ncbi:hypothetical protein K491DRAFT_754340 [Lophiostoma macrostomum CBS 122681]|uniref:RING-type domain-containing protein n=1 Tax=Lophiostoma macrostomum CBS 122681 TaxID=1314788 RepID=A0A6A6TMY7_9PLEO|nr:hypothetical protein K491DRAFT_754340 [Lophiostoma macrostomum CBS 122681]
MANTPILPSKEAFIRNGLIRFDPTSTAATNCTICFEPFDDKHSPVQIAQCSHIFGGECLHAWLSAPAHTCPLCRAPLFKVDIPSDTDSEEDSWSDDDTSVDDPNDEYMSDDTDTESEADEEYYNMISARFEVEPEIEQQSASDNSRRSPRIASKHQEHENHKRALLALRNDIPTLVKDLWQVTWDILLDAEIKQKVIRNRVLRGAVVELHQENWPVDEVYRKLFQETLVQVARKMLQKHRQNDSLDADEHLGLFEDYVSLELTGFY